MQGQACLPAYLCACCFPACCLPACLPACLHACLLACLPACLPACVAACAPCLPAACLPACLPARLPACLPASLPSACPACCCLPGLPAACLLARLLARPRLLIGLPAGLASGEGGPGVETFFLTAQSVRQAYDYWQELRQKPCALLFWKESSSCRSAHETSI